MGLHGGIGGGIAGKSGMMATGCRKWELPLVALLLLMVVSCSTAPVTGRSQLDLVPDSTMLSMSFQQYDEFLQEHEISRDRAKVQMVRRVGRRIQEAVEEYFARQNLSNELEGYRWEFNLVEDDQINAFAMPGGKVVVYTGILPVARDETGLAVIMGHEIAHAVAKHGNERMSQMLVTQMAGMGLAAALQNQPGATRQLAMAAFGAGATVGFLLPYSRVQESEADRLGLIFMAMAGYDPHAAVDFWKRMASKKEGKAPPEFLSTHPADETRIRKIQQLIPEALQYYKG
jgi:predicted Zn-dependent protease